MSTAPDADSAPVVLAIEGPAATVALLNTSAHSDKWAEAWQVMQHEPSIGQPRWYLVRIEHEGRDAVGFAVIDDEIVADARAAGLPDALGITARIVAILPDVVSTTAGARWIVKQVARWIAREAGDPPYYDTDVAHWRAILGVLTECIAQKEVRESLT
jgi:hypothetical protein